LGVVFQLCISPLPGSTVPSFLLKLNALHHISDRKAGASRDSKPILIKLNLYFQLQKAI
jgi:hypothetical protein